MSGDFDYLKERRPIVNKDFDLHFHILAHELQAKNQPDPENLVSIVNSFISMNDGDFNALLRKMKVICKSSRNRVLLKNVLDTSEKNAEYLINASDPSTTLAVGVGFLIMWLGGMYGAWNNDLAAVLEASWVGGATGMSIKFGSRYAFDLAEKLGYPDLNLRKKRIEIFNGRVARIKEELQHLLS